MELRREDFQDDGAILGIALQGVRASLHAGGDVTREQQPRCFVYRLSKYGFGSNLLGLIMTAASYSNLSTIYVDESDWSYKCNNMPSWPHFFTGAFPRCIQ